MGTWRAAAKRMVAITMRLRKYWEMGIGDKNAVFWQKSQKTIVKVGPNNCFESKDPLSLSTAFCSISECDKHFKPSCQSV